MHPETRVVVEAPAKLNLFLDITGRLPNGYHSIDSVMQAIDLADTLVLGRTDSGEIRVACSRGDIPTDRGNLAFRAAEAFFAAVGLPVTGMHIHIDKAIPSEAGMGGGSADAAAVLTGLNALFEAGFSPDRLCELGLTLGADVPFFVRGGCARAEGIGEKLTPLFPGLRPCWIAIAKPEAGVNTAEAYAAYDRRPCLAHTASEEIRTALATGDLRRTGRRLYNLFEQLTELPDTERIKAVMGGHGAVGAALTGSGSAVYGLFPERDGAESCLAALEAMDAAAYLARPVEYGARIAHKS